MRQVSWREQQLEQGGSRSGTGADSILSYGLSRLPEAQGPRPRGMAGRAIIPPHLLLAARPLRLSLNVQLHGVFLPWRQTGQAISHFLLDRPAPGLKERNQIFLHLF